MVSMPLPFLDTFLNSTAIYKTSHRDSEDVVHVSNSDLRKSGMNPIHYIELELETKEVDGVKKKVKKHCVAA